MKLHRCAGLLIAAFVSAAAALADVKGVTNLPTFTAEEMELINRNSRLMLATKTCAWRLRRALDVLEDSNQGAARAHVAGGAAAVHAACGRWRARLGRGAVRPPADPQGGSGPADQPLHRARPLACSRPWPRGSLSPLPSAFHERRWPSVRGRPGERLGGDGQPRGADLSARAPAAGRGFQSIGRPPADGRPARRPEYFAARGVGDTLRAAAHETALQSVEAIGSRKFKERPMPVRNHLPAP